MIMLSLGKKIRNQRKEKEMSLRELAGNFVSKAHLSLVGNNKRSSNMKVLKFL